MLAQEEGTNRVKTHQYKLQLITCTEFEKGFSCKDNSTYAILLRHGNIQPSPPSIKASTCSCRLTPLQDVAERAIDVRHRLYLSTVDRAFEQLAHGDNQSFETCFDRVLGISIDSHLRILVHLVVTIVSGSTFALVVRIVLLCTSSLVRLHVIPRRPCSVSILLCESLDPVMVTVHLVLGPFVRAWGVLFVLCSLAGSREAPFVCVQDWVLFLEEFNVGLSRGCVGLCSNGLRKLEVLFQVVLECLRAPFELA